MTLRWIVVRSSSGSARPRGGPGPPTAGFVMACPWRPRYLPHRTIACAFLECTLKRLNHSFGNIHSLSSIFRFKISIFRCVCVCLPSFQGRVEVVNGELTVHKVQPMDSAMYQCVAENKYGAIYSSAELKILGNFLYSVSKLRLRKHSN